MKHSILMATLLLTACGGDTSDSTANPFEVANDQPTDTETSVAPTPTPESQDASTPEPITDEVNVSPIVENSNPSTIEPTDTADTVEVSDPQATEELDIFRCDDVGTFPVGWNPTAGVSCRLDLVDSAEVVDNGFTPFLALEVTEIPMENMLDVPLVCKRLIQSYYCNCDNSITDLLADAQEPGDIFFTATLRDLNQSEVIEDRGGLVNFDSFEIEGSWIDDFRNTMPLYRRTTSNSGLSLEYAKTGYVPPFFALFTYQSNAIGDLFIHQRRGTGGGDDTTTVSQCVIQ